jgi:hypothetical protein
MHLLIRKYHLMLEMSNIGREKRSRGSVLCCVRRIEWLGFLYKWEEKRGTIIYQFSACISPHTAHTLSRQHTSAAETCIQRFKIYAN